MYCKKCKKEVEFKKIEKGPHIQANCGECGSYIKFVAQPLELARMPFGKHEGELLIESVSKNIDYYQWLLGEDILKGVLRERIESLLEVAK